jgi:hypothetical protein
MFNIEVDLVFKKREGEVLAVEVKSLSSSLADFPRLSLNQIHRLRRAQEAFEIDAPHSFSFAVCFVSYENCFPQDIWFRPLSDFF